MDRASRSLHFPVRAAGDPDFGRASRVAVGRGLPGRCARNARTITSSASRNGRGRSQLLAGASWDRGATSRRVVTARPRAAQPGRFDRGRRHVHQPRPRVHRARPAAPISSRSGSIRPGTLRPGRAWRHRPGCAGGSAPRRPRYTWRRRAAPPSGSRTGPPSSRRTGTPRRRRVGSRSPLTMGMRTRVPGSASAPGRLQRVLAGALPRRTPSPSGPAGRPASASAARRNRPRARARDSPRAPGTSGPC